MSNDWPRLSVNLHPTTDAALRRIMDHDGISATEAVRRAIAVLAEATEPRDPDIEDLIERSSLGSPEAKALRAQVDPGHARAIVRMSEWMERAEKAEAEVRAVEALADKWAAIGQDQLPWAAQQIRAALAGAPAVTPTETQAEGGRLHGPGCVDCDNGVAEWHRARTDKPNNLRPAPVADPTTGETR